MARSSRPPLHRPEAPRPACGTGRGKRLAHRRRRWSPGRSDRRSAARITGGGRSGSERWPR